MVAVVVVVAMAVAVVVAWCFVVVVVEVVNSLSNSSSGIGLSNLSSQTTKCCTYVPATRCVANLRTAEPSSCRDLTVLNT